MSTKRRVAAAASPEMRTRGKRRKVSVSRRVLAPPSPDLHDETTRDAQNAVHLGQSNPLAYCCAALCATLDIPSRLVLIRSLTRLAIR